VDLGLNGPGGKSRLAALIVLVCALAGVVGYNLYSAAQNRVVPKTRTPFDFVVTWRCLSCGHTLEDRAAVGPRTCPECGKDEMYVSIQFSCRQHGTFPVAFNYEDDGDPSRVKVDDGDWVPYLNTETLELGTVCPVCKQSMNAAESPRSYHEEPVEELPSPDGAQ